MPPSEQKSSKSKEEDDDKEFKDKVAEYFGKKAGSGLSFDQALLFDEHMLNSWFQEMKEYAHQKLNVTQIDALVAARKEAMVAEDHVAAGRIKAKLDALGVTLNDPDDANPDQYTWSAPGALSIDDRADVLENIRMYKETSAHKSTEIIEGEITTKMLFDALLFAVAFSVPTGVDREEMERAYAADVLATAALNLSFAHLGTYDAILTVMTFFVTTSTGLALVVGFSIYSCLRYERPITLEEADKFYARFRYAFRLSYGFTYAAILIAPFSCYELHMIKTGSIPMQKLFTFYGYLLYAFVVLFLIWSLHEARESRAELLTMRYKIKRRFLKSHPKLTRSQSVMAMARSFRSSKTARNTASSASEQTQNSAEACP